MTEEDRRKPRIALASGSAGLFSQARPSSIAELLCQAVRQAGGLPFLFHTPGVDEGLASGHRGAKYGLPSRELIADGVESMVKAHDFDGLICIHNGDISVPGMAMAAVRCNVPTLFLGCGPEVHASPSGGLEQGMTASGMSCLCEALGLALPGDGTIPASNPRRKQLALAAGAQVVALIQMDLRPLDILTPGAIDNALALDMAMGGHTDTVLQIMALVYEAGFEYPLARLNEVSARVPTLCRVNSAPPCHVAGVDQAGGVSAILWELSSKPGILHLNQMTVTGKTLGENIAGHDRRDPRCIRSLDNAFSDAGALKVLHGNLAPEGAVTRTTGLGFEMLRHSGPARVYESDDDARSGILGGRVQPGEVVVVRYAGPKGGPGMPKMRGAPASIIAKGLDSSVALISDGWCSANAHIACIGHVSPEAAEGGPLALVETGDVIKLDIPAGTLEIQLSPAELERRRAAWNPQRRDHLSGWLARYARLATNACKGAVLAHD